MKKLLLIVVMAFCAESLMAREPFGMNLRIIPGGPLKMIEEKIRVHRVKSCREYRIELIDGTKIKDQTALLSFDGQGRLLGEIAYDNKKPLSKTFIDEKAKEWADRVSVYRNLLTLCEKGILRKISSEEGGVYLLVNQKEKKQHMHFQCRHCHRVIC